MVFQETYGSVWTYLSFQFQMNKKEREIRDIVKENLFCWRSNLSDDDIISYRGQVWKQVDILEAKGRFLESPDI